MFWRTTFPTKSTSSGGGAVSDSISKEIGAEDVGAMTLCGKMAAVDSVPTPNVTSPMQLLWCNFSCGTSLMQIWNQSIPKKMQFFIFKNQYTFILQLESIQCKGMIDGLV